MKMPNEDFDWFIVDMTSEMRNEMNGSVCRAD